MQTHRASCEKAREENLTRSRRSRGSTERERSRELAQGGAGDGGMGDGGFTLLGMDLCRGHIMGSKNCAKAGLCSCERQEMGSGRPRGAGRGGEHCSQVRSPTDSREGKKELARRRDLAGRDQVLTQLRARLCTALHGQQDSNLPKSSTSLPRLSLDRGLARGPHSHLHPLRAEWAVLQLPTQSQQHQAACPTPPGTAHPSSSQGNKKPCRGQGEDECTVLAPCKKNSSSGNDSLFPSQSSNQKPAPSPVLPSTPPKFCATAFHRPTALPSCISGPGWHQDLGSGYFVRWKSPFSM